VLIEFLPAGLMGTFEELKLLDCIIHDSSHALLAVIMLIAAEGYKAELALRFLADGAFGFGPLLKGAFKDLHLESELPDSILS
jgi:hypothetical protein